MIQNGGKNHQKTIPKSIANLIRKKALCMHTRPVLAAAPGGVQFNKTPPEETYINRKIIPAVAPQQIVNTQMSITMCTSVLQSMCAKSWKRSDRISGASWVTLESSGREEGRNQSNVVETLVSSLLRKCSIEIGIYASLCARCNVPSLVLMDS